MARINAESQPIYVRYGDGPLFDLHIAKENYL